MKLESNNHSVFSLNYHLVLVVKYRRKVINDEISARLREIFEYIQPSYRVTLQEWNHDIDHVHVLFSAQAAASLRRSSRKSESDCGESISGAAVSALSVPAVP